jgi:hypothetical protein
MIRKKWKGDNYKKRTNVFNTNKMQQLAIETGVARQTIESETRRDESEGRVSRMLGRAGTAASVVGAVASGVGSIAGGTASVVGAVASRVGSTTSGIGSAMSSRRQTGTQYYKIAASDQDEMVQEQIDIAEAMHFEQQHYLQAQREVFAEDVNPQERTHEPYGAVVRTPGSRVFHTPQSAASSSSSSSSSLTKDLENEMDSPPPMPITRAQNIPVPETPPRSNRIRIRLNSPVEQIRPNELLAEIRRHNNENPHNRITTPTSARGRSAATNRSRSRTATQPYMLHEAPQGVRNRRS